MRSRYKFYLFLLSGFFFQTAINAQQTVPSQGLQVIQSGFIFSDPPFESCHASSIVEVPGKKIMAVWFGGKHEAHPGVSIWMSEYEKGKWGKPKEIANGIQAGGKRFACWNPVLFRSRNGLLFLHYKVGVSPRTWWAEMKTSVNNGRTWSAARKLSDNFLGPIKNKPIQLVNGDILYPSSTETEMDNKWTIHLERSDSAGNNWQKISIDCDTFAVIQPSILRYGKDSLQLLCRSRQNVIAESWSFNGGNSWQPVRATTLPNPNSGTDAVSLANGCQLLVYNPLPAGKDWWLGRSVLKIAISANGHDWKDIMTLEEDTEGEYSYPAFVQGADGTIHLSYTFNRKKIKYVALKLVPAITGGQ